MTSTKSSVHLASISAVTAVESTPRQKIKKEKTLRETSGMRRQSKGM